VLVFSTLLVGRRGYKGKNAAIVEALLHTKSTQNIQ